MSEDNPEGLVVQTLPVTLELAGVVAEATGGAGPDRGVTTATIPRVIESCECQFRAGREYNLISFDDLLRELFLPDNWNDSYGAGLLDLIGNIIWNALVEWHSIAAAPSLIVFCEIDYLDVWNVRGRMHARSCNAKCRKSNADLVDPCKDFQHCLLSEIEHLQHYAQ